MSAAGPVRAVGLISGTSMDGIDAAAVEIREGPPFQARLCAHRTDAYPDDVRSALVAACLDGAGSATASCRLNMVLGDLFAESAVAVIAQAGWKPEDVICIGSHGQTTVSDMSDSYLAGHRAYSTLQLASPAAIAERTGIAVVANFRARDIAAGGRGAPLVPMLDALLYALPGMARAILNLGGIANVTLIPATGDPDHIVGFDTGPANMPLDALVRQTSAGQERFDRDGELALRGQVHADALGWLLNHPFLAQTPPKATGSEDFGDAFVSALRNRYDGVPREDLLATLVRFAAQSVTDAIERWFPNREHPADVVVSGGGVRNHALMRDLTDALAPTPLVTIDAIGGNSDAKEAVAFAVLAYLTLRGRAGNLPSVTGAGRAVPLGCITPGRRSPDLLAAFGAL
jgi:anhydro-N-acetylmuramic acid kinase